MALFNRPRVLIWPQHKTTHIFFDRPDQNSISFDTSLLKKNNLDPIVSYLGQNKIQKASLLLPDEIVLTKSFVHDAKIESIDQKEVVSLAKSFINFDISPTALKYRLFPTDHKTIIQTNIVNQTKLNLLLQNLRKLNLKITRSLPVSAAISQLVDSFYQKDYFLVFPETDDQYLLLLAKNKIVYLTEIFKGSALEIQKTINYSKLYFDKLTQKFFVPTSFKADLILTSKLDRTQIDATALAQNLKKPRNLPLPVLGFFITDPKLNQNNFLSPAIIKPSMEDSPQSVAPLTPAGNLKPKKKKNFLPVLAVFIVAAAVASTVIWYILNRDSTPPAAEQISPTLAAQPTATSTPTVAPVDKDIELQVLNATDINGQAASLKAKLVKLGFTNVTLGNSDETLTQNEVRIKADGGNISAYFKQELATDFPASHKTTLKESSKYDAVFVIGTDLRDDTPTPAEATATPTTATEATATATPTTAQE